MLFIDGTSAEETCEALLKQTLLPDKASLEQCSYHMARRNP